MILSGVVMTSFVVMPVELMVQTGIGGVSSLMFGGMLVVLGLITWFTPNQHVISGSLAGFLGLGALILSNLGGLVIGTLLALVGGGLAFSWRPVTRPPRGGRRPHDQARQEMSGEANRENGEGPDAPVLPPPAVPRAEG